MQHRIEDPDIFFRQFPKLPRNLRPSSEATEKYICFSLAVGDTKRIWSPCKYAYWLPGVPRSRSVSSFVKLFTALGYVKCADGVFERGVRKIAIFSCGGQVKHVAVQPPGRDGKWHSKMGGNVNIMHTLAEISGDFYGSVSQFMRERKPSRAGRVRISATTT